MRAKGIRPPRASVIDLFCGAGGLSYGFKTQAFELAAGIDIDEACRYPYEANNDAPFLRRDVGSLRASEINKLFVPGTRRVLVGCAPCQPFSTYNQKNQNPNWRLLRAFGDLIAKSKPDVVSMENVPRLIQFKSGRVFADFLEILKSNGYLLAWDVLYGPDFGLAQTRSRLVLLASRLGEIALPKPTHRQHHRTVKQEIGSLRPLKAGQTDKYDPLHKCSRLNDINLRRISAAAPGGTWKGWPKDLVAQCHQEAAA